MRKIICVVMAAVLMFSLAGCVTVEVKESGKEVANTQSYVFVEGHKISKDDVDMVGVFVDYTNGSDKTCCMADDFDIKAYQNGVELPVRVYTGQRIEDAVQCDTTIQGGTTARVVWTFTLNDDSPVSVECSDGQKYTIELN